MIPETAKIPFHSLLSLGPPINDGSAIEPFHDRRTDPILKKIKKIKKEKPNCTDGAKSWSLGAREWSIRRRGAAAIRTDGGRRGSQAAIRATWREMIGWKKWERERERERGVSVTTSVSHSPAAFLARSLLFCDFGVLIFEKLCFSLSLSTLVWSPWRFVEKAKNKNKIKITICATSTVEDDPTNAWDKVRYRKREERSGTHLVPLLLS